MNEVFLINFRNSYTVNIDTNIDAMPKNIDTNDALKAIEPNGNKYAKRSISQQTGNAGGCGSRPRKDEVTRSPASAPQIY